jgi:predicted DNA-binding antitoxin AbrB/MazE fold protein
MIQHIKAIYDHGVLRPLEPLILDDQAVVSLSVEATTDAGVKGVAPTPSLAPNDSTEPTLFDVFNDAGLIGRISGLPADLSTDPRHMKGFGDRDR